MPETIFDGRLRGSGQTVDDAARYTSSVPLRHRARTRNEVPDTGRVILAPRASHGASRDTPSFRRDAAALRSAEASVPATASESTTAATADDVGAGASDDADDKSFGQSVGASTDGLDSSPHTSVRARGRDCSTQTPWRLRPAGFAGVDSPIAFHEILVLLYALRRVIVTPDAPLAQGRHTCA